MQALAKTIYTNMGAFNLSNLKLQNFKYSRTFWGGILGTLWMLCAFMLSPNNEGAFLIRFLIGLALIFAGAEYGAFIANRVYHKRQFLIALSSGFVGFFLPFFINQKGALSIAPSMFTALLLAAFSVVPRKPLVNAIKYGGSLGAVGGFIWGLVKGSEYLDPSLTLLGKALVGALIWSLVIITMFLFYWIMNMYTPVDHNEKDKQEHISISE